MTNLDIFCKSQSQHVILQHSSFFVCMFSWQDSHVSTLKWIDLQLVHKQFAYRCWLIACPRYSFLLNPNTQKIWEDLLQIKPLKLCEFSWDRKYCNRFRFQGFYWNIPTLVISTPLSFTIRVFPRYLAKFQSITNREVMLIFGLLFQRICSCQSFILICLVLSLTCSWKLE